MSYAVETKKRKFHRVLESLTKPSSTPALTKSAIPGTPTPARERTSLEHSSKKARLDFSELPFARSSLLSTPRPTSRASNNSTTPSRPSFVPWDRERFLERLETFRRVDRWAPKPAAINEVEWAKRGWICNDVARVVCVGGCGGSVVVKLPDELDELDGFDAEKVQERKQVRTRLVEEYVGQIVTGHGENCPWRNKGCDATIHRLPLSNPDVATSGLCTRYSNLVKMADQLPEYTTIQTPESLDLDAIIGTLPTDFGGNEKPHEDIGSDTPQETENGQDSDQTIASSELAINKTAFALALFGWDSVPDGTAGLAGCSVCFRRLGLWMYKPKANGTAALYDSLDVIIEHMEYCPWVNGTAQSGTGRASEKPENLRCGWQLLSQALQVRHRRHVRSTVSVSSRAPSEAPSTDELVVDDSNPEAKKARDREWWAKLRRMRQVLNVKSPRKKSVSK
ncbi:hypothetical protein ASPACDRAFT_1854367 [Aspergillus aculeatus ATCC 16872]|uniref:C3HC-type domain-containing protein n=1 Tax=Aspergillus aculeatus (strain ATCC 16872 / CBS 172.66 / WB 5094) TaxID=690307 RepID=A0A1L9X285_ASPA1|nr:uncharacterized protein ASPACDRAFT_1854367 [Aspergillus aculeatus ATCC 16872]OJK02389.1 hypothetical protein ASPACDRAFT_1854367 [Aspergillus aculeatus ATCC 16872]